MKRILCALWALLLISPVTSAAENDFFPLLDYAYDTNDRAITHESTGTGGTEPISHHALMPGGHQNHEDWWNIGDLEDPARKRMRESVDDWKRAASRAWYGETERDAWETDFDENVVGSLLVVRRIASRYSIYSSLMKYAPPCAVFDLSTGRQLALSDLFYDGFNYIDYINAFLALQPDKCFYFYRNMQGNTENMFIRSFTGLPRDYPYFGLDYSENITDYDEIISDPLPVMLQILWHDRSIPWEDPVIDDGDGYIEDDDFYVGVPLTHWASPYGECLVDVRFSVIYWQERDLFIPRVSIDQGRYPEAEQKINETLREMFDEFLKMDIPNLGERGDFDYQISPSIKQQGQRLYIRLSVPVKYGYSTMFDVCFDLHTGDRINGFWEQIDGNNDLYNLNVAALKHQLEIGEPEARLRLTYSGQGKAIDRLRAGEIDLAFVVGDADGSDAWGGQAPNEAEAEFSKEDYEYIPIAHDALIVVCNEAVSVKNLTIKRLQEIFVDPTSLKLASGSFEPVTLYLSSTATSEAIARRFLDGIENAQIVNGHTALYRTDRETGTLAFVLRSGEWRDHSFEKLKVIAVDGVLPTIAAIIEDTYPLSITCYAVLRRDLPDDHPARALVDWLLSDDGQRTVRDMGYAPLKPLQ